MSVTPAVGNVFGQLTVTTGRETSTGQAVDVTTRDLWDTKQPPSDLYRGMSTTARVERLRSQLM
ncbi:MAG: hypothetical protein A6D92_15600 [Symbiobacterium thermophilum]|uniref:Uncharacterized protein n=1 Tax=Symbiobacterium thermophilum TaxID=2734 RepID=A0A1Y2T4C3_SYMTR|nr:MAG: hypothetical protein A6D92_15600 [Symbiobacterium thermophilum]PZN70207.1 MAG: hypothetical protein DIU55_11925 [Bacillota bacterium]